MAQKFLEQFRRLPNFGLVQKIQDKITRPAEGVACQLSSIYGGVPKESTCFDYDEKLSLLAIGTNLGLIHVYGAPGVMFEVTGLDIGIVAIKFIQEEGRMVVATKDSHLILFELNSAKGAWEKKFAVLLPQAKANEQTTCIALGKGVVYVGSDQGNVRQVAVHEGKMMLGDEVMNTLTTEFICKNVPLEKHEELGLDSSVISLEVHAEGCSLLVAFNGGTVAVAKILSVEETEEELKAAEVEDAKGSDEKVTTVTGDDTVPAAPANDEVEQKAIEEIDVKKASNTMAAASGSKATDSHLLRKSRTLTMFASGQHDHSKCKHGHYEQPDLKLPRAPQVTHFLPRGQAVHSASWRYSTGNTCKEVIVAYGDGAHQVWGIHDDPTGSVDPVIVTNKNPANIPYGPMPCCAIEKVMVNHSKSGFITAFTGGMPRASFSEMYTVSVLRDQQHVCFRFSAPVVDFKLIAAADSGEGVTHLVTLSQNELVIVDLTKPDWPQVTNPYLSAFDPVTALAHTDQVPVDLIKRLVEARCGGKLSSWTEWPIKGGSAGEIDMSRGDVLALGHEKGAISLWFIGQGGICLSLGAIDTSSLFVDRAAEEDESWPPFRCVGCGFHSANESLPAGLAIRVLQLQVAVESGDLLVTSGGDLGQISIWSTGKAVDLAAFEPDVSRVLVELATEDELKVQNFEWNGPALLKPKEGFLNCTAFKPTTFLQMTPPSPVHSVEMGSGLLACASCYGFALITLEQPHAVQYRSFSPFLSESPHTVEVGQEAAVSDVTASLKTKSRMLKTSLRQSFKKLKKLTSTTQAPATVLEEEEAAMAAKETNGKTEETSPEELEEVIVTAELPSSSKTEEEEAVPVPVQLFPATKAWSVRTLKLASIPVSSEEEDKLVPSLLVGTDAGVVSIYSLPSSYGELTLCKELKLQHGAPIVGLYVLNSKDRFSPVLEDIKKQPEEEQEPAEAAPSENGEVSATAATAVTVSYDLLVCTEEQLKLFTLPSLKPKHKYKFVMNNLPHLPHHSSGKVEEGGAAPAVETNGCCYDEKRVRSVALQLITTDWYVVCSLSNCQVAVLSLPNLRRQVKHFCCVDQQQQCACATAIGSGQAHVVICVCDGGRSVCLSELCSTSVHLAASQKDVIKLPEWARPGQPIVAPIPIVEEVKTTVEDLKAVPETLVKVTEEIVEKTKSTIADVVNNEVDKSILNGTQLGDMTHDVVTDYLSNDSTTVSVKTVEHSTEKRTLIKGGEMVTTVRETKKVDGKIVEDDSIKLSSVKQEN